MSNKPRLEVIGESKTGLNTHFRDNQTREKLTRGQVANKINQYEDYHIVKQNGKRVIRSNPDRMKNNNLE